MNLSLTETARLLNKSDRQVRYLIKHGGIPARKVDGRWVIRREDLPLSDGQVRAATQKQERAARLAMEVLQPGGEPKGSKRFSVRELRAFREGAPLYRELISAAGADHPAAALLRETLMLLACGYHEFESRNKAAFYSRSREQASRAAMALLLEDGRNRSPAPSESAGSAGFQPTHGRSQRFRGRSYARRFASCGGTTKGVGDQSGWEEAPLGGRGRPLALGGRARGQGEGIEG